MKVFIASDIHGSAFWCRKMITAFKKENADIMLLLGDILYHGPRNDLPDDYNPKQVIEMLNFLKSKIMCVRGNCDAEVDQMVLDFPIMADYVELCEDGTRVFATHGHKFNAENPPKILKNEILLCGHTHVQGIKDFGNFTYVNPGSVSLPKENTPHGYAVLENGKVTLKCL